MIDYQDLADNELMKLVTKQDERAFSMLYDRYNVLLINYFYKMLWQDREKAQDFMQDFFAKLIEKPKLFDPSRNFKTWMYSVANNMCKNEYRKQANRSNTAYGLNEETQVADKQFDMEKKTDEQVFKEKLNEELDKLDENQKSTFVLRYFEELSVKEIAKTMNCSEGTVKSRIFYTLKKLSESLKEYSPQLMQLLLGFFMLNK